MAGQCDPRGDEWEEKARKAKNKMAGQCDARGDEWEEKARKAKNKMAGQCEQHRRRDGTPDRQTDRKIIKMNQSFVITLSLNSDPKETCAKT